MKYLDAGAMLGAHFAPREGKFFTAEDLIEEMDFFGIDQAVVYHGLAREYDFTTGNTALMESVAGNQRLCPCWVIGPGHTGDIHPPAELVKEALKYKIAAVRLFFGGYLSDSMSFDMLAYRELLAELEKHCLPVIVEFEGPNCFPVQDIMSLDSALAEFPELPIILSCSRIAGLEMRTLYPRLEQYENLHLMTCGLHGNGFIEDIVSRFGNKRLVLGTNFPWFGAGQTKIALSYANIPEQSRQAIAYGNMDEFIKGIK